MKIYRGGGCPCIGWRVTFDFWIGHYGDLDVPLFPLSHVIEAIVWMFAEDWREYSAFVRESVREMPNGVAA